MEFCRKCQKRYNTWEELFVAATAKHTVDLFRQSSFHLSQAVRYGYVIMAAKKIGAR